MITPRATSKKSVYFRYFKVQPSARRWGWYVTTCGESRITANHPYPPVEHPPSHHFDWDRGRRLLEYQIVYISEGSGLFETDKMTTRLSAGDAILLVPGLWHRYQPDRAVGWHEHWVGFSGQTVQQIFGTGFFSRNNPTVRIRGERSMLESFHQLFRHVRENTPALQQVMAGQTSIMLSLIYSSTQTRGPSNTGLVQSQSQMVEQAKALLVSVPTREIGLTDLAKKLNVSYSSFRRTFREHTGVSPHQYRIHLKVSAAREMLRSTSLAVKEIGYRCGFEDEQYFCRIFKQQTGDTPSRFRKS